MLAGQHRTSLELLPRPIEGAAFFTQMPRLWITQKRKFPFRRASCASDLSIASLSGPIQVSSRVVPADEDVQAAHADLHQFCAGGCLCNEGFAVVVR
jgi:hypothetical protein